MPVRKTLHSSSSTRRSRGIAVVLTALLASLVVATACEVEPDAPAADRQQVLRDLVANVIVPTYVELTAKTGELQAALQSLRQTPSADTLATAQRVYREARALYKTSEAYLLGPADDLALTGEVIDSWPADAAKIEATVAGTGPLDPAHVSTLGANQRGFPGLEQLLFDSVAGDGEVLARLVLPTSGARRAELLVSLGADLTVVCKRVSDAMAGPTGFGHELAEAGVASTLFTAQREGVDKVVTALVYASELMVMKKFAKPLGVDSNGIVQPALEEGPRSDSSLADLQSNLLGMQAIYSGQRGAVAGLGLGSAVRAMNGGAAARFEQALAAAQAALAAVPPPFRVALTQNRAALETAYQAVRAVKQSLVTDVAGALGASIGFGFSDTD